MDLPTRLDLHAIGRDIVLQNAKKIEPSMVDTAGSDANLFVGSTACVGDTIVKQLGYGLAKLTLDGAVGEDLDRYAYDRYQLTRKGASPALGSVRIYRSTLTGGSGSVPVGTVLRTLSNVEYVTTSIASFGLGDYTSKADVRATQAGKATQVGKNFIRQFSKSNLLFDGTLQVNNDVETTGGEDAEDDETFRNRIRTFWATARRGILAAIVQGATSVPGVVSAIAIEALAQGMPARVVNLYIADSSGVANQQLAQTVYAALDDYRAAGIAVIILTTIPQIIGISLVLQYTAGVNTVALQGLVQAALVSYVNSLPANGKLLRGGIYSVLQQYASDGVIATQDSILSPVGDIVPAIGQTLRTVPENITFPLAA